MFNSIFLSKRPMHDQICLLFLKTYNKSFNIFSFLQKDQPMMKFSYENHKNHIQKIIKFLLNFSSKRQKKDKFFFKSPINIKNSQFRFETYNKRF